MGIFSKWIVILLVTWGTLFGGDKKAVDIPAIVTVKWLKSHYNDPHLVIIDVRKPEVYAKGHLERAVNMPVFRDLFDQNLMLPKLDFLKEVFSKAGIDKDSLVVAYGDNQMIWAARLYWVCEVLGHKKVGLLDVGYGNWQKGALPETTKLFHPQAKEFVPNIDHTILNTQLSVLLSIGKEVIIDGRPEPFYLGKKSHAKRFGHIPTALNYPGMKNYERTDSGSHLKNLDLLAEHYRELPKDKKIILYCEDGADAALNYIVLKSLGYKASVYEGSWLEWGNNPNLPIENPSKQGK
jgi:thiosulfate/3-mercaptopyruvate sulfurtransferase